MSWLLRGRPPRRAAQQSSDSRRRWLSLVGVSAAQIGLSYLEQGVPALAPYLKTEFHLSSFGVGLFGTSVNLGRAATTTFASSPVDRFGERRMIIVGGLCSGALAILAALSHAALPTLGLLVLCGVCQALALLASISAVANWFRSGDRGLALGIRQAAVPVGGALAAASLPLLAFSLGWRRALVFAGLLAMGVALLGMLIYHDHVGAGAKGGPVPRLREQALRVLQDPNMRRVLIVGVILASSQYVVVTYIQLFMVEDLHVSLRFAGYLLTAIQVAGIAGRLFWGAISDLVLGGSRRGVLLASVLLAAAGSLALCFAHPGAALWPWMLIALLLGFATMGSPGIYIALISDLAAQQNATVTMGVALTFILGSTVLASPLFGVLVDVSDSYRHAWLALGILLLLTIPVARSIRVPGGSVSTPSGQVG
jgi:sugar phosphate permease